MGGGRRGNLARRAARGAALLVAAIVLTASSGAEAWAVTPHSPEVQKMVANALAYLEKPTTDDNANRLGGKCLVGLVFLKAGRENHPRVAEALEACRQGIRSNPSPEQVDIYSNGLAVIFLCELAPQRYSREIQFYLDLLRQRQKPHGGWGYHGIQTGDTSQTQYATLCYWEAHRHGFRIDGDSLEGVARWMMRSQDPNGCWGYQGIYSETDDLVPQTETGCSMLAAGLGSAYICADLLEGGSAAAAVEEKTDPREALPSALRPTGEPTVRQAGPAPKIRPRTIDRGALLKTIERAHSWMDSNYEIDIGPKVYYYLYALERYKSFEEAASGAWEDEPKWYNDGYEYLVKAQAPEGYWQGYCGPTCDTAFATLFLLRSTQKSLRGGLGEGTLLAGRGIPSNVARAKLRHGQLVVEQVNTRVEELLSLIDEGDAATLDDLARNPGLLIAAEVDERSARRLLQLVRGGEPEARLLAVRALGRSGNLDHVPALLFALTDPDRRIVLEARDGLQFISRRFEGFGPPDDFNERQRFEAVDAWKNWYRSLRPNAILEK